MHLKWTSKALEDLVRLHDFLAVVNPSAAVRTVQALTATPVRLLEQPRLGERLDEFEPQEVRRIFAGPYEMRYEIRGDVIYVMRLWHSREDRSVTLSHELARAAASANLA